MNIVKFVIALIIGYVLSILLAFFPKIAIIPILGVAYLVFLGIKSSYGFLFGIFGAGLGFVIAVLVVGKCLAEVGMARSEISAILWLTPIAVPISIFLLLYEGASRTVSEDKDDNQS